MPRLHAGQSVLFHATVVVDRTAIMQGVTPRQAAAGQGVMYYITFGKQRWHGWGATAAYGNHFADPITGWRDVDHFSTYPSRQRHLEVDSRFTLLDELMLSIMCHTCGMHALHACAWSSCHSA
jgi:hypothetical protein